MARAGHLRLVDEAGDRAFDGQLVAAREGDRQAVQALLKRAAPTINRVVVRTLGPDTEHDDLVNEALLQVARSLRALATASAFDSWVVGLTVRVVRKELRRRRYRRFFIGGDYDRAFEVAAPTSGDDAALLARFMALLRHLPDDERLAFGLRHLEAMTVDEVAETLETSRSTIKRRLAAASHRFFTLAKHDPMLADRFDFPDEEPSA
jgi:RNA polymerase sigma-70 factor, ECF subfamily